MAKTAVVNPRGRDGRFKRGGHKRKRNPAPAVQNPRRKRRRSHAAPASPRRRRFARRRRNPTIQQAYSSGGYRQKNPGAGEMFDIDRLTDIVPAATAGVWAVRWALKMAGPFENIDHNGKTIAVPGLKHAFAGVVGASVGGNAVGQLMGEEHRGTYAEIAGLGFAGDLFARTRLFADSQWVQENLLLAGVDDCESMGALQQGSALGGDQYVQGPDGTLYLVQTMDGLTPDPAAIGALQQGSALGSSSASGFGYAVGR